MMSGFFLSTYNSSRNMKGGGRGFKLKKSPALLGLNFVCQNTKDLLYFFHFLNKTSKALRPITSKALRPITSERTLVSARSFDKMVNIKILYSM